MSITSDMKHHTRLLVALERDIHRRKYWCRYKSHSQKNYTSLSCQLVFRSKILLSESWVFSQTWLTCLTFITYIGMSVNVVNHLSSQITKFIILVIWPYCYWWLQFLISSEMLHQTGWSSSSSAVHDGLELSLNHNPTGRSLSLIKHFGRNAI